MDYKIVRFFAAPDKSAEVMGGGLTLEEAQAHCNDPETSSASALHSDAYTKEVGEWFDGYMWGGEA